MEFHPGSMSLIGGLSGEGKTTLINLIAQLYVPDSGAITLCDVDLRQIALPKLRRKVAIVSQDTAVLPGTILDNIKAGSPEATMTDVVAAAKVACCHPFISAMPHGYHTKVGESGQGLSAGQRQRLLIARCVLRDPSVLILDEGTGMLDLTNEQQILSNLRVWLDDRISIIVSHRASLKAMVDRTFVMRNKRLHELQLDRPQVLAAMNGNVETAIEIADHG